MIRKWHHLLCSKLSSEQLRALDAPDQFLLSIITINLNNACRLQRTINSLGQCDKDVEYLFIDGGSSDHSVEIAKSFYSPSHLISEPDGGIYNAMNKGLYRSRGKYLLWLNSGDELLCDICSLKAFLNEMDRFSPSLISCSALICYEGQPERDRIHKPSESDLPNGTIPHQAVFFNRKRFKLHGPYDERYKIVGDRDLILRVFKNEPSKIIYSEYLVAKWYHGGITTTGGYSNEIYRLRYKFGSISLVDYTRELVRRKIARIFQIVTFLR